MVFKFELSSSTESKKNLELGISNENSNFSVFLLTGPSNFFCDFFLSPSSHHTRIVDMTSTKQLASKSSTRRIRASTLKV